MIEENNLPVVIGVDLGGTQLRAAVLQGAEVRSRVSLPTREAPTPNRTIPCIYVAIQLALDEAKTRLDQITGIGLAVAGLVDNRTGVVFTSPNLPGWDHVPLRDIFEEHYNIPVFVENDANGAGLGEYMFGAGRGSKDMVYLTISTGIGGGVIVNGQIMEGTSGTAAELGHMTIDRHGDRCNCGNIGCLESIASGAAIARRANEAIAHGINLLLPVNDELEHDPARDWSILSPYGYSSIDNLGQEPRVDAQAVARAARAGIPEASKIIKDAAEAIGIGLVNIIHIFNPDRIILGGGLTQMGSLLMEPARQIVRERTMTVPYEDTRIVQAQLGIDAGLIGAGALVYYHKGKRDSSQCEEATWSLY